MLVSVPSIIGTVLGVLKVSIKYRRETHGIKVVRVEIIMVNQYGNATKHRKPFFMP
jgi:hypothetical protein